MGNKKKNLFACFSVIHGNKKIKVSLNYPYSALRNIKITKLKFKSKSLTNSVKTIR